MKWILIRHGQTQGNREHRYIGCRTDEPLCPEGIAQLQNRHYPPVSRVFVSPMRRCVETASLLYPGVPQTIIGGFRECDFGDFENKNYAELNGRADYQAWIDSGGELPCFRHAGRAARRTVCDRIRADSPARRGLRGGGARRDAHGDYGKVCCAGGRVF